MFKIDYNSSDLVLFDSSDKQIGINGQVFSVPTEVYRLIISMAESIEYREYQEYLQSHGLEQVYDA